MLKFVTAFLALLALSNAFAAAQSGGPACMYVASVRWLYDLPIWCEVVLSTVDKAGNVNDIGQIIPSVWCDDIYYPTERQSAVSEDGSLYYYAVTNPQTQTSVLYTFNTQTKAVSSVSIPFTVQGNNGQPLRSLRFAAPGLLAGAYGNVLGFLNATSGQMTKKVSMWSLTHGCNATKYSGSDLNNGNIYVECINDNKAKPCQFIYTINIQSGKVIAGACMPANRGMASIVAYMGAWNASNILTINANMLGPSITVLNPVSGTWGQTYDTYGEFVAHKMSWGGAGKAVWDQKNGLMYVEVVIRHDAYAAGIAVFDIGNGGHFLHKAPYTQTQTWEGYELLPNSGK